MKSRSTYLWGFTFMIALLLLTGGRAAAQPDLTFQGIVLNWPLVKLTFSVRCNQKVTDAFDWQHFKVYEDSVLVGEYDLNCPSRKVRCPVTVALVLDASGSMAGEKNESTIFAALDFVDNMDPVKDQAAVIWFNDRDTLVRSMTHDLDSVRIAIDSLPAQGTTAVWDATWSGISQLVAHSSPFDSCRAVVVLTDGLDNASKHILDDVINYALVNSVRVFTVGLGNDANGVALAYLASRTGGRYFAVATPDMLPAIYQEIFLDVIGTGRCEISYKSSCSDGKPRTVELKLVNFCGGSDSKIRTFIPPSGPEPKSGISIGIRDTTVRENTDFEVAVELLTDLEQTFIAPGTMTFRYDTTALSFLGLGSLDSTILRNAGQSVTTFSDGFLVQTLHKVAVSEHGILTRLRFHAKKRETSGCPEIRFESWDFAGGCLAAYPKNGKVCVVANEPLMMCTIDAPDSVAWVPASRSYVPSPFKVTLTLWNQGERTARGAECTLEYDTNKVASIQPISATQPANPVNIAPDSTATVSWLVVPKVREKRDSIVLCIRTAFENSSELRCCAKVDIPEAGAVLACALTAPDIYADSLIGKYVPMPFEMTAFVRNEGGRVSDTVMVTLSMPKGFSLEFPSGPLVQRLTPPVLRSGESGIVKWWISHPISLLPSLNTFVLHVNGRGDSTECGTTVTLPPLIAAHVVASCTTPDSLQADTLRGGWTPNPFTISVHVINDGNAPADDMEAQLILPPFTQLASTSEPLRKPFSPTRLAPDSSVSTLSWDVRIMDGVTPPPTLGFRWVVTGHRAGSNRVDTFRTACYMRLAKPRDPPPPGSPPVLVCSLDAPDTVRSTAMGPVPAPVRVVVRIENIGGTAAAGLRATLLQDARFTVRPPAVIDPGTLGIGARTGDDGSLGFLLDPRLPAQDEWDTIRVLVTAPEAAPYVCSRPIFLEHARAPQLRLACSVVPDTIGIPGTHPWPIRDTAYVHAEIRNDGDDTASAVVLSLGGTQLTTPAGNLSIPLGDLAPGSAKSADFAVRALCGSGGTDSVRVMAHASHGAALLEQSCVTLIHVLSCSASDFEVRCDSPDTLVVSSQGTVTPDPFRFEAVITNSGGNDMTGLSATVELPLWAELAAGETLAKLLPTLAPGSRRTLVWKLRGTATPPQGAHVCVTVTDTSGRRQQCCAPVQFTIASASRLLISCFASDSSALPGDTVTMCARVSVTGAPMAGQVRVLLDAAGSAFTIIGSSDVLINAPDTGSAPVVVCLKARATTSASGLATLTLSASAPGVPTVTCSKEIRIEQHTAGALACELVTVPADSVLFDESRGVFMAGDPMAPDGLVRVRADVRNVSAEAAHAVRGLLMMPAGVELDAASTSLHTFGDIAAGGSVQHEWRVKPVRSDTAHTEEFRILISADGRPESVCMTDIVVGAAPRRATLEIPDNLLAGYGDLLTVPVIVGPTVGRDVHAYRIIVRYDASLLEFINAVNPVQLDRAGWAEPASWTFASAAGRAIHVASSSNGSVLASGNSQELALLRFRVLFGGAAQQLQVVRSPIEFLPVADASGTTVRIAFNAIVENDPGNIVASFTNGAVTLSGACVVPLEASAGYALKQNRPNPFNPSTMIDFTVPAQSRVVIDVLDLFGRPVTTVCDREFEAGTHALPFNAGGLAAGTYLYRMRAGEFIAVKRMAILK